MQFNQCALVLAALTLTSLAGCDYTSDTSSDSGTTAVAGGTPGPTPAPSKPGFGSAGSISGTDDTVVATASSSNVSVVVGATQNLSITFASSDGLTMTGFGLSGALGSVLPAGWSGPASFICASVNTGSGCVLNLAYSPTAVDSGTLTITYVVVDNAGLARTPASMTVAYVATANNNVDATAAPTGQVAAPVGGGAQAVSVDFFTDDGNPATNLTVTTDLTALPAGWSTAASSFSCAIVSTGNGCLLALRYAPSAAASGALTLNYAYTDDAGESKTGTLTIPYFTTSANDVIASVTPGGQITAARKTGGVAVPVNFTTNNGAAATKLSVTSNLKALPAGWSAASSAFACASVSTGNGCQLMLRYAPTALGSGTLSLSYTYVDESGIDKTGLANISYTATTNDNVVATSSQTGQVTAVVGMGAQALTVTFTTDDSQPATALEVTSDLTALPAGWSSTDSTLACSAIDADTPCTLPLSYAPSAAGSGTLSLRYSYKNNAGESKTGTLAIPYRATTNDTISGTASPSFLSVRTGSSTPVTVTFTTSDGNPASSLSLSAALTSLPAGWSSTSTAFTCATISAGTDCTLSLTYAPTTAVTGGALNLPFGYTNDAGFLETNTVSISYSATTPYLYVANGAAAAVSACPLNIDNSLGTCVTTGNGLTMPSGIAFDGNFAYVTNDSGTAGTLVSECTLASGGLLTGCTPTGGTFTAPTSMLVNAAGTYAYVEQSAGLSVCAINAGTGALSGCAATGSMFAPLAGVALSADGTQAYAVHAANEIDVCQVGNGTLSSCTPTAAPVSQAVAVLAMQNGNLYVSTSAGALYVCPIASDGSIAGCQTTAAGSNAVAVAFLGSTAYVSGNSTTVLVCPVNSDGTLGSCTADSDPTFSGAAGLAVH